jgi:hypothetical protein
VLVVALDHVLDVDGEIAHSGIRCGTGLLMSHRFG